MADVIKQATRDSYGIALCELGSEIENMYVLDADLAGATKTGEFKKKFPERHINCGIAEQNMMGIAAGLATTGSLVFASSFAVFAAGRVYEQIRNSICYPNLNVKIGATHGGISVGEDGASHQMNEDFALMRALPNMTVICPADGAEAIAATKAAARMQGPVYLRYGRLAIPVMFDKDYDFQIGKGVVLREGTDVTIIACGLMVERALAAADQLAAEGINARVINMATIKPIDRELVIESAKATGAIVTAEEHSIIGGLGGAVAEVLAETVPVPVMRVGVEDKFGKSGPAVELLDMFGLNAENIVAKAKAAIALKK